MTHRRAAPARRTTDRHLLLTPPWPQPGARPISVAFAAQSGYAGAMHGQIVDAIGERLGEQGPLALLATPSEAVQLRLRVSAAPLLLIASRRPRRSVALPTLCGDPGALPLRPRSLQALVAVNVLGRTSDPAELLCGWSFVLRPGAQLIIAEEPRALRAWRRPAPEELTACLLNGGFADIGQAFRGHAVLTWGRRLTAD